METIKTLIKMNEQNLLTKPITIDNAEILQEIKYHKITPSQFKSIDELDNLLRQAIFFRTSETKDIYEGEIIEVRDDGLLLRAKKGTLFVKTQIKGEIGDIIYIEGELHHIIGRVSKENDLECKRVCILPKEVHKIKERFIEVSLNELDESFGFINHKVKNEVNSMIKGREVVKGNVLFLEAERLSDNYLSYIKYKSEGELCPTIFLCGKTNINSINIKDEFKLKKEEKPKK
ncbi:hypothetical protein H311_00036, partial [Anncaliia algerae PRA109]